MNVCEEASIFTVISIEGVRPELRVIARPSHAIPTVSLQRTLPACRFSK